MPILFYSLLSLSAKIYSECKIIRIQFWIEPIRMKARTP